MAAAVKTLAGLPPGEIMFARLEDATALAAVCG